MEQDGKLTVLDPHGQPSGIFGRRLDAQSNPRDILDPVAQPSGSLKPISMAPRLAALDGKTVYLVKIVIRHKRGTMFTDDPALWSEIKSTDGDAAILGVGG